MRIAFIGDLQYATAEEEKLDLKMKQIRALKPELAIVMGDVGGSHMHSVEGWEETKKYVDMIGCPWELILGNHDVEYSPWDDVIFDYEKTFPAVFDGRQPFAVFVKEGVLFILVGNEHRPAEVFNTHNAVYVSDERFALVKKALDEHKGVPTVMVTHAPAAGSGLRCWVPLHSGATDKYLDQMFDAFRWRQLGREYPQIKLWLSAHFHMSHEYDSAITVKEGIVHVSCGVMTICARDDIFQTRILDINGDEAVISTFDHSTGEFRKDASVSLSGNKPPAGRLVFAKDGEVLLGYDKPEKVWRCERFGRYYVSTENGIIWEYQTELDECNGTISLKKGADQLSVSGNRLYVRLTDGNIFSIDLESDGRLDRIGGCRPQERREESELRGDPLPEAPYTTREEKEGLYVRFK